MGKKAVKISDIKEDDEIVFELFVNGELVSSVRILQYSFLGTIWTIAKERRKGYGKTLLLHIEKIAKKHNVTSIETTNIDPYDKGAISFFRDMHYTLEVIENDRNGFLKGRKTL